MVANVTDRLSQETVKQLLSGGISLDAARSIFNEINTKVYFSSLFTMPPTELVLRVLQLLPSPCTS